jgi:ATP-binding cassette subfamily B multidrug efflux pump
MLGMMFWISPLLALIALVTIPISMLVTAMIGKRSQKQASCSSGSTPASSTPGRGVLHRPRARQGLRPPGEVEDRASPCQERRAVRGELRAQFISGIIMPR